MAESRISTLRTLWAPKIVKYGGGAVMAVAAYDGISSQFNAPKLGEVLGMSGTLLPWWGWLLVLQAIFVYALFEYVRRLQMPGGYDDGPLRERVELTIQETADQLRKLTEKVTPALDTQIEMNATLERRMVGIEASSEELTRRLDEQRAWLNAMESTHAEPVKRLEDKLGREVERIEALIKKLDSQVRLSFYAIRTYEALQDLAKQIKEDADILYSRLRTGEVYDRTAWDKWENVHNHWLGVVRAWVENGKWYYGDLTSAVLEVPDHKYSSDWTVSDNQFPDAEAVRVFKKHRIIQSQWEAVEDKVRENLYYVAYHGMSDTEIRRGEPAR